MVKHPDRPSGVSTAVRSLHRGLPPPPLWELSDEHKTAMVMEVAVLVSVDGKWFPWADWSCFHRHRGDNTAFRFKGTCMHGKTTSEQELVYLAQLVCQTRQRISSENILDQCRESILASSFGPPPCLATCDLSLSSPKNWFFTKHGATKVISQFFATKWCNLSSSQQDESQRSKNMETAVVGVVGFVGFGVH